MTSIPELNSLSEATGMKFTLKVISFLICLTSAVEGIVRQPVRTHESQNRFDRGAQTFEYVVRTNDSTVEEVQNGSTTLKPLPPSYTVVDWKRFYPFGDKFPDSNHTRVTGNETTTPEPGDPSPELTHPAEFIYPVYVKVPIRVPLKAPFGKREVAAPKIVMPRTIRGGKNLAHGPHRPFKMPPRYMMVRRTPMRRKFVTYYKPFPAFRKHRTYVKPMYYKTGIHDLHKNSVYYPLRAQGYEVTEPSRQNWFEPDKVNTVDNYL